MIEARQLVKTYRRGAREVHALRGVDLRLERGDFAFILGPSGSGKSTLLHLLGALDRASGGTLLIDGQDTSRMSDAELTRFRRERVGFVFQAFNLIPSLTALDNVLVPLLPRGIAAADRQRAAALLARVGLADRVDHRPNELSGGEQQRVAVARALFKEPLLVLADEPTGELDSETGAGLYRYLRELNRERATTFVVVTHDPTHRTPADGCYRIADGRIVERHEPGRPAPAPGATAPPPAAVPATPSAIPEPTAPKGPPWR